MCRYLVPFLKRHRQNLRLQNQITSFSVRCRLNLTLKYLSYQVNLSTSTIHATFQKNLDLMYCKFKFFITTQDRDHTCKLIPPVFKQFFPNLTNIFDCFEIFIKRSKNLTARAQVYSTFKKINFEVPNFLQSYWSSYFSFTRLWWPYNRSTNCPRIRIY